MTRPWVAGSDIEARPRATSPGAVKALYSQLPARWASIPAADARRAGIE